MSAHLAIAIIPVAVYLILIGALRLRTRPLVTTGWRDTLTLGIAASGLVAVGPMQLFFPTYAAAQLQGWVWLALLILYLLVLMLILLSTKPRLIAYGLDVRQFRDTLMHAACDIDPNSHWSGDVLSIPSAGIQLALEPSGASRVHQVLLIGLLNNLQDWFLLEKAFVRYGRQASCPRSTAGLPFVIAGTLLLTFAIMPVLSNPGEALAQLREFLNR